MTPSKARQVHRTHRLRMRSVCGECGHSLGSHRAGVCNWKACPCSSFVVELSPREIEVVRKIAGGLHVKDVARELNISFKTAEAHKYNAMVKLNAHNAPQLIGLALRHRLIETADLPALPEGFSLAVRVSAEEEAAIQ